MARCTWPELISTNDADAVFASRISPRTSVRKSCSVGMVPPLLAVKHMGMERPARHPRQGLLQFKVRRYPPTFNGRQFPTQELRIGGSGRLALANSYPPFCHVDDASVTD